MDIKQLLRACSVDFQISLQNCGELCIRVYRELSERYPFVGVAACNDGCRGDLAFLELSQNWSPDNIAINLWLEDLSLVLAKGRSVQDLEGHHYSSAAAQASNHHQDYSYSLSNTATYQSPLHIPLHL